MLDVIIMWVPTDYPMESPAYRGGLPPSYKDIGLPPSYMDPGTPHYPTPIYPAPPSPLKLIHESWLDATSKHTGKTSKLLPWNRVLILLLVVSVN